MKRKIKGVVMPSCLGLYIQENIIKYAKVSKDHDTLKVESFGVKCFENLSETIDQIVKETYCFKTPISVNLNDEMYKYFDMFTLLNKKDLQKAIKTEFESYCAEKGYNPNALETRYALVNNLEDKDKIKVIHISSNKIELNKKSQELEKYRLTNISPISMTIPNIANLQPKENAIIVNIEDDTTMTTVIDQKVYDVEIIDEGAAEFLSKINLKENSMAKSYEVCKNTTIYTAEGRELGEDTEGHLEDIMPTLYNIVGQVRKKINESLEKIQKVYITGTASCINNIDLYFQEYLTEVKCEILKPYFISSNIKEISIKDYIEVNSAISLALQGLNVGIEGINFKKQSLLDKLPEWTKIEIGSKEKKDKPVKEKNPRFQSNFLTMDFNQDLSKVEFILLRTIAGLMICTIVYGSLSVLITKQISKKQEEADVVITETNNQIANIETDISKLNANKQTYETMISKINTNNTNAQNANASRNSIPNLLNQIMCFIPEQVQITSIENTTDKHIVIYAKAAKYEQLGIFKAKIQNEGILKQVVATSGVKEADVIQITIEGDLP